MAIEKIKIIKEAEAQAEQIRKDSNQKAKEMIAEAEIQAASLLEETAEQMEDAHKAMLGKAEEEAKKEYERILAKAAEEIKMSMALAEKNIDTAASVIVGKVVK